MDTAQRKASVALLSVVSNTSLVAAKVVVGWLTGSVSVLSEAAHSAVDLLASAVAFYAVRTSSKPADPAHPFGHGKIENISGAVEALLILAAAVWIVVEAIGKLLDPLPVEHVGWGVLVMLASVAVNVAVSRRLFRVGEETDSMALKADAWHLRTDVWTSAGVMVGLALVWLGGKIWPHLVLTWVDPVAALVVAAMILRAGVGLTLQSARDLLDSSLTADEEQWIRDSIARYQPRVVAFHHLRTRKAGPHRFVEFHLQVGARMSVQESHAIAEEITQTIQGHFEGAYVNIHVEPCDGTCAPLCVRGCFLAEDQRQARFGQRAGSVSAGASSSASGRPVAGSEPVEGSG